MGAKSVESTNHKSKLERKLHLSVHIQTLFSCHYSLYSPGNCLHSNYIMYSTFSIMYWNSSRDDVKYTGGCACVTYEYTIKHEGLKQLRVSTGIPETHRDSEEIEGWLDCENKQSSQMEKVHREGKEQRRSVWRSNNRRFLKRGSRH